MNSRIGPLRMGLLIAALGIAPVGSGQVVRFGPNSGPDQSAYNAFVNESDVDAKIHIGEEFDERYPQSTYLQDVDVQLVYLYYARQNWPKFYATADKVIEREPDDVAVLRLVGWVIPRVYDPKDPSGRARLDKAEKYENRALALIAATKQPKGMTDEQFTQQQISDEWQVHSGLGVAYFRLDDYASSARELQLAATQEAPKPDPMDLYTLGIDLQNLNRTSEAVDAFQRCAEVSDEMQEQCKGAAANPAAEAAYVAFKNQPNADAQIQFGQAFDRNYPESAYAEDVETTLLSLYDGEQDWDRFYATADEILSKDPDNIAVLALVGWVIPHHYDASAPGEAGKLDDAEKYEKHAIELISAMQQTPEVSAEQFNAMKVSLASQAHSGLAMTYFRRNDFENSVKEMQIATAQPATVDPQDLYVLGIDFIKLGRPADATDAFTKCSQIPGGAQEQCKKDAQAAAKAQQSPPAPDANQRQ
jgi:hypothetical protein